MRWALNSILSNWARARNYFFDLLNTFRQNLFPANVVLYFVGIFSLAPLVIAISGAGHAIFADGNSFSTTVALLITCSSLPSLLLPGLAYYLVFPLYMDNRWVFFNRHVALFLHGFINSLLSVIFTCIFVHFTIFNINFFSVVHSLFSISVCVATVLFFIKFGWALLYVKNGSFLVVEKSFNDYIISINLMFKKIKLLYILIFKTRACFSRPQNSFKEDVVAAWKTSKKFITETFYTARRTFWEGVLLYFYYRIKNYLFLKLGLNRSTGGAKTHCEETSSEEGSSEEIIFVPRPPLPDEIPTPTEDKPFPLASSRISHFEFGLAFFFFIYIYIFMAFQIVPRTVYFSREGFSSFIVFELVMFVYLFLCFLAFFGLIKKYAKVSYILRELYVIFLANIASIFFTYAFVLLANYYAYTRPFNNAALLSTFYMASINFHSQDFAMLLIKPCYLSLASLAVYMIGKYLIRGKITFQYVVLSTLILWSGLFLLSFSNILYILLMLDTISLATVAVISLSAVPGFTSVNRYAFHYYLYSVLTSVAAYAGCVLIYSCTNTFNVNAITFIGSLNELNFIFDNPAFTIGVLLILIKFLFFFGIFPFQQYLLEVSPYLNFGFLYVFLVVSKFPVLVSFLTLMKIVWLNFEHFRYFILLAGLISILYSVGYIAKCTQVKKFLALSSINQIGFIFTLFYFNDLLGVYVSILFFIVYAISSSVLYLFFASFRSYNCLEASDGDFDTWLDVRRFIADSYIRAKALNAVDHNRFNFSQYFYISAFTAVCAVVVIAGIPPMAGFFLKMAFIEVFLVHMYYKSLALIMLTTLISSYAYFNMLIMIHSEFEKSSIKSTSYPVKVSNLNAVDCLIFILLLALLGILTLIAGESEWFWQFANFLSTFFFDNHFYFYQTAEEHYSAKYAILFFFMSPKMRSNWLEKFVSWKNKKRRHRYQDSYTHHVKFSKIVSYTFQDLVWKFSQWASIAGPALYLEIRAQAAYCAGLWRNKRPLNFFNGSYADELAVLICCSSAILVIHSCFFFKVENYYVQYFFCWWILIHIIFVNFLSYWIVYSITYSVFWYRLVTIIYALVSTLAIPGTSIGLWIDYFYRPFYLNHFWGWTLASDLEIIRWHCKKWADLYLIGIGSVFWAFWLILIIGAFNNYNTTLKHISRSNDLSTNADYLRAWVNKSFCDLIDVFPKHYSKFVSVLALFFVFGPADVGFTVIRHDFITFFTAVYLSLEFFTANFVLISLLFWTIFGHFLYCQINSIRNFDQFIAHYKSIALSIGGWMQAPEKFASFIAYLFTAVWMPIVLACKTTWRYTLAKIYIEELLISYQVVLTVILIAGPVLIVAFGIMRYENSGYAFLAGIFFYSLALMWFFINLTIQYNCDSRCKPGVAIDLDERRMFEPLFFGKWSLADFGLEKYEILSFGYDYFALLLCVMTTAVFSFVFLVSLYNSNLQNKKLFFLLLLILEIFTLMSFLSTNLLGFIVYFEATLLPMALIVGYWGSSDKRWAAAKQFFLYSLTASVPALVGVVYLYIKFGTLSHLFLLQHMDLLTAPEKLYLWCSLLLLFAVKIPMFPAHSWLLNAHVEAPTAGSIILAAVMLKLGSFGMIRYMFGLMHDLTFQFALPVCALAMVSVIFSAASSIGERDAKVIVAQTSIAHMNLVVIGLFSFDARGFYGALYLIIGHAVVSTALFYIVGIIYDRVHTRQLDQLGGLTTLMPMYSCALFFFTLANAGFPWSLSFVGELMILMGVARNFSVFVYLYIIIIALLLLYSNLRLFVTICFGTLNKNIISNATSDLSHLEFFSCAWLVLTAFLLMWGNDLLFSALYHDLLIRHVLEYAANR